MRGRNVEAVYIRKIEGEWAGFSAQHKQVTKPACKNCVLKLLLKMTKNSTRYRKVIVINEDGTETAWPTGVDDAGKTEES